jgi:broad specificity phosphatase PhoE
MCARALNALNDLTGDTALFTHGGVIAFVMAHLFPEEKQNRYQWQPKNAMGYAVSFDGDKPINYKIIGK